jgi:hypothetical protein
MAVNFEVIDKGGEQLIGKPAHVRSLDIGGNDRKFIAAKPRDESVAGTDTQAIRNLAQQQIADSVPIDIVDLLKSIEVEAKNCKTFVFCLG